MNITVYLCFLAAILKPEKFPPEPEDEEVVSTQKSILKDSAVLGTLIGVCLFIIIIIVILTLLTKLGYSPGSKLAQSKSVLPCIHFDGYFRIHVSKIMLIGAENKGW